MTYAPISSVADLPLRLVLKRGLDPVGDRLERRHADRALLAGLQQAVHELLPVEPLPAAVLLHDHVRDFVNPLVAREPAAAVEALTPAPDDLALVALPRVHDLVAEVGAVGTLHGVNGDDK